MKLSGGDFRFLTAWVQGVDVHDAWDRYMRHHGTEDLRRVRSTVRALLDELAAVARRQGDLQTAALLRRDSAQIKLPALQARAAGVASAAPSALLPATPRRPASRSWAIPTLEEFATELEDASFYSEAELVELLEERYGKVASLRDAAGRRVSTVEPGQGETRSGENGGLRLRATPELRAERRRGRLVRRQLEALRRLEVLAATRPTPLDSLAAWLDPTTTRRLALAGVLKISELLFFVGFHGYRWYRKVPRIGEEGAARLIAWLRQHEDAIGVVSLSALAPRSRLDVAALTPLATSGVVPIERLRLPSTLAGIDGSNRAPAERCSARARHDYAAVMEWLDLRRPRGEGDTATGNAHTFRAYRKEAERFLLWAVFERHKALSSLDHVDCAEYRRFLAAPGPTWVGGKVARWSAHWRPFEGPLAAVSRETAETIVKSMCDWLVEVRYLDSNPWVNVPQARRPGKLRELRSLSDRQWELVQGWLLGRPRSAAADRLCFMFGLALATGMRAAELASARAGWLRLDNDEEGHVAWNLVVVGKGAKEREVPLTARIAQQLADHLVGKGLAGDLAALDPCTPLLSALGDPMRPMDGKRVYELMKRALRTCAAELEHRDPRAAARIAQASPHWMRHTHGRKFVEAGGDRGVLRQNLGHASDATTAIYDRSEAKRRRRDVERVFG